LREPAWVQQIWLGEEETASTGPSDAGTASQDPGSP
jgi:hypothetical protein